MGREVKRVPRDFDWPTGEVWEGYLLPERLHERDCKVCDGDGLSKESRAIADTFYPHQIGWAERSGSLAWHDKIGQAEVDNLIEHDRLAVLVRREPTEANPRDREWQKVPRLAAEVNASQGGIGSHDAINRMILVEFRCERLGIPLECSDCEGHGSLEEFAGQRVEAEAWEPIEPPVGEGWQMWETTSEGSPSTPVFATPEELAKHCAEHVSVFGREMADARQWLRIITGKDFAHVEIAPGVICI